MAENPPPPVAIRMPPALAALMGGSVGLVVMFFPPHFITLFFAPLVGGTVAGMRAKAGAKDALLMCAIIATLITGIAAGGAFLMVKLASDGDGGLGLQLKKLDITETTTEWAAAGLWSYAAASSFVGAVVGGFLKRIG